MVLNKSQKIGFGVVLLFLIAMQLMYVFRSNNIIKNKKFGICYVYSYSGGSSGGSALLYHYFINENKYEGSAHMSSKEYSLYKNKFYKVNYSSENPSWSRIVLDKEVTDTTAILKAGFSLPKKKRNQFKEDITLK